MMRIPILFSSCDEMKPLITMIGFIYLLFLPFVTTNELLSSSTPPKKYIVTEPGLGLWNQLMTISCAMVMANFTGRNLYINGIKPDYQFGNTVEASKLIDLDHLTHSVAPKMGIHNPNFIIADFNNRTFIPKRCVRKSKLHDNSITVYEWIKKVDEDCEIIDIGFSLLALRDKKAEYLFSLSEHIASIYKYIQFNQQIMDLSKYLQQQYVSNCQNALVIHYRIEDDMLQNKYSPSHWKLNMSIIHNMTHRVNEIRNIIMKGYFDLTIETLQQYPTNCVYICTNAEEKYINQLKNIIFKQQPTMRIVHNPLNNNQEGFNILYQNHPDEDLLPRNLRKDQFDPILFSGREIRGAIDFLIANQVGNSFIGMNCSTFSDAMYARFQERGGHVMFLEKYLAAQRHFSQQQQEQQQQQRRMT